MNTDIIPSILIMLICIVLSGYFSATETAFSSFNKTKVKALAEKGDKRATLTIELSEQYDKLISTILVGNNIVNIAASSIATLLFVTIYGDIGATISTVVITIVVLIFGEITPKCIAKDFPEQFARFSAPMIHALMVALTPIVFIFSMWKKLVSKMFHAEQDNKMSQEELLLLVDEVEEDGSIDASEGELLRNAIEFRDLTAEEIITHRMDIEGVEISESKDKVAEKFTQTKFSRLLVYDESVDNIIGVIHQKDFYVNGHITEQSIEEIMTKPVFIPQTEKLKSLLENLQANKSHMAIVVDEYGGTLGIVTMEDILEELVGKIWDEHDDIVEDFKEIKDNEFLVDCSVSFNDFCEFFDIDTDSECNSLGGWVVEQFGKIPESGEQFDHENISVEVADTDGHRITNVKVVKRELVDSTN